MNRHFARFPVRVYIEILLSLGEEVADLLAPDLVYCQVVLLALTLESFLDLIPLRLTMGSRWLTSTLRQKRRRPFEVVRLNSRSEVVETALPSTMNFSCRGVLESLLALLLHSLRRLLNVDTRLRKSVMTPFQ